MNDDPAFPYPLRVDPDLPPSTIRIEAAEVHLVRLDDESAEFVAGPLDGLRIES